MQPKQTDNNEKLYSDKEIKRKSRKAFLVLFGVFALFIIGLYFILKPRYDGAPTVFRKVLNINEKLNHSYLSDKHLAKEYPKSAADTNAKVNGDAGMNDSTFYADDWLLRVVNFKNGSSDTLKFTLDEIKKLPKIEVVFNFKCIEGWNQISWWGGVRLSDFLKHYKLGTRSGKAIDKNNPDDLPKYVGMETPDKKYYVGIDMASALHPQTILCYELNGKPLPGDPDNDQGAPLRLIIPVKYGVKHLKRIGTIFFSDTRPRDYWYKRGYDYDAAL